LRNLKNTGWNQCYTTASECSTSNSSKNSFAGRVFPFFRVLQVLTVAFLYVDARGNVEQALIGFGILHDGRRLPFHREHNYCW
jgi:hypothetical protein